MALGRRGLIGANLLLVALLVIHALDHALRQTASVPAAAATAGLIGQAAALGSLGLAIGGHRLAWPATASVGLATAIGFVLVHLTPDWGPFSQPYADLSVDTLSWAAMLVPGLVAGLIGVAALRRSAEL